MELVVDKIRKIQNKCQSLKWGYYQMSDDEVMFVVGNKAYPKEMHFFVITATHCIYFITDDHKRDLHKQCVDDSEIIASVISLLKEWYPAK